LGGEVGVRGRGSGKARGRTGWGEGKKSDLRFEISEVRGGRSWEGSITLDTFNLYVSAQEEKKRSS